MTARRVLVTWAPSSLLTGPVVYHLPAGPGRTRCGRTETDEWRTDVATSTDRRICRQCARRDQ